MRPRCARLQPPFPRRMTTTAEQAHWQAEHARASQTLAMFGAAGGSLVAAVPAALAFLFRAAPPRAMCDILVQLFNYMRSCAATPHPFTPSFSAALIMDQLWSRAGEPVGSEAFRRIQCKLREISDELLPLSEDRLHGILFTIVFAGKHVPDARVTRELMSMLDRAADDTEIVKVLRLVRQNSDMPLYRAHGRWALDSHEYAAAELRVCAGVAPAQLYRAVNAIGLTGPRFHAGMPTRFESYPFGDHGLFRAYAEHVRAAFE